MCRNGLRSRFRRKAWGESVVRRISRGDNGGDDRDSDGGDEGDEKKTKRDGVHGLYLRVDDVVR